MYSRYLLLCMLLVCATQHSFAQAKPAGPTYDFLPREKVIFADNFMSDTIGDFPARWRMSRCIGGGKNDSAGMRMIRVQEDSLENILVIAPYTSPHIEQNINSNHNINDIFTLEYDFYLGPTESNVVVDFQIAEQLSRCYSVHFMVTQSGIVHYTASFPKSTEITSHFPGYFDLYSWHHLAISCFKGSLSYYIDQHKLVSIPATGFNPIKYDLSGKGPVKIRNFRVATGVEVNEFYKLLSAKKMVLHNILFYDEKSIIKSVSMRYLLQLAQFLKANPSVNMEIDVHSDNSGEASIIRSISQARADEIRHQLAAAGVDGKRLTSKGFGDTIPLKPNDSPEGMAANRRVEFIVK